MESRNSHDELSVSRVRGEATLQCGRAPRTRQCDPGNSWWMVWAGLEAHHRSTLAGFTAQPKNVFLPPRAVVHRKTRQQRWSRLLELFHFSEHVFQKGGASATFSNVRRVTEPTLSQNGNRNPRVSHCWQVTKETLCPGRHILRKRRSARFQP